MVEVKRRGATVADSVNPPVGCDARYYCDCAFGGVCFIIVIAYKLQFKNYCHCHYRRQIFASRVGLG